MVTFYHVHLSELLSKNKSYTHLSLKQDHPTPEFPLKLPYFTPTSTETVTISLLGPTTKKEKSVRKKKKLIERGYYLFIWRNAAKWAECRIQNYQIMYICLTQIWRFPEDDLGIYTSAVLLTTSLYLLFLSQSEHMQKIRKYAKKKKIEEKSKLYPCYENDCYNRNIFLWVWRMRRNTSGDFAQNSDRTRKEIQ